jgi:hypothetical protein
MKKSILLVACVTLLTVGAISVSCSKDDDWKGCNCTYIWHGEEEQDKSSAEEIKEYTDGEVNSCAELEEWLRVEYPEGVKCSNL